MKVKIFLSVLIAMFLLSNFVLAEEPPSLVGQDDYDKLQGGIDQYSPLDSSGEVNLDGYKPFISKADERIQSINLWLEENAMWLSIVFGMTPRISLHFFANLYIIFFLIVFLVLNSQYNLGMIPGLERKISSNSSITYSKIAGIATLILFMVTKVTVTLGKVVADFITYVWEVVIPTSIILAIILIVILIVILIFCPGLAAKLFEVISKLVVQDVEKKAASEIESDKAALHKLVEEATKD